MRQGTDAAGKVGATVEGIAVTEQMAEAVQLYLDFCRPLLAFPHWIERRFDLERLRPPVPMFGTTDFAAFDEDTGTLHIADLKFGQGVVVEAQHNVQLMYYALGALISVMREGAKVKHIRMTIVQPRAAHADGPVRSWEITFDELAKFATKLMRAAHATTKDDAPLVPSAKACRWCKAAGICPAQREQALAVAQTEFSVVEPLVVPNPETIPAAEFAALLSQLELLEDFTAAMKRTAMERLERGEDVPGWKLVERRATRQWVDAEEVARMLRSAGFDDELIYDRTLKSVAQVEKLAGGKKAFGNSPLTNWIIKKSSGLRLAPDSDPSPAVSLTAGSEFPLLPAGD